VFSDILVVPEALGQGYQFRDNGGVVMDYALKDKDAIAQLDSQELTDRLQYVAQAIRLVKGVLRQRTALLGFAGSPWTLANFMLEGGSARKPLKALELFHRERGLFELLAEKLTLAVIEFLKMQVEAGVDAIQIFDSMGGLLPPEDFEVGSGQWIYAITSALGGKLPVIVYSKGTRNWKALVRTGAQVLGVDHGVELAEANKQLPAAMALQGNLNPELLRMARPAEVAEEARRLLEQMRGRDGYIFNLGHGVPPEARMENLEALVQTVRSFV
jgi:uroporphyrinogen decarboxylase